MELIKIKDNAELEEIKEPVDGQIVYNEIGENYFIYKNEKWFPLEAQMTSQGLELNLYELNRNIIEQLPDYEDSQWEGAEKVFGDWLMEQSSTYYMLYGREINYFTIFKKGNIGESDFATFWDGLKECLTALGVVRSINVNKLEDGSASSIEIWIKYNGVVTCMYLFNYDEGIVTYEQ